MASSKRPQPQDFSVIATDALPSLAGLPSARANAERYRAIADSSFDLICELDSEGQFAYISPSFGVSTGLDVASLQGASFFDSVPAEDCVALIAEYTAALAGTRVGRAEHRFELGNGDFHWFESALRGIGAGDARRVVVVSREITARQRHQVELETLISLAKGIHSKHELGDIARAIWQHLDPLLPATALLITLPGAHNDDALHVVGETSNGPLYQVITRESEPNCPLWEALEREEVWLENAWSGANCGLPVRLALDGRGAATRRRVGAGRVVLRRRQTVRVDGRTRSAVPDGGRTSRDCGAWIRFASIGARGRNALSRPRQRCRGHRVGSRARLDAPDFRVRSDRGVAGLSRAAVARRRADVF